MTALVRPIAIIPARGGSKRLPNKNLLDFGGRPMIAWSILAARESRTFERIVISTDSPEIAAVAETHGAEVPFLRDKAYDDHAPVSAATCATLLQMRKAGEDISGTVVQLMPNCPLRTARDIVAASAAFHRSPTSFQISCFRYGWMNPWWAATLDTEGHPKPIHAAAYKERSQDLPPLYCPTGAIWIAEAEALLRAGTFYGPGYTFLPLPWQSAVDIDDADDLEMARAVLSMNAMRTNAC